MSSPSSQPTPVRVAEELPDAQPQWAAPSDADRVAAASKIEWDERTTLSPTWNPPNWWDSLARRTRALAVLAGVVVVAITLWATGAWKVSTTPLTTVSADTAMTAGPYSVRFYRAVYESTTLTGKPGWRVTIYATCQNISGEGQRNDSLALNKAFLVGGDLDDGTFVLAQRRLIMFSEWDGISSVRNDLPPGLPPVPCEFSGEYPANFKPTGLALVGMRDLVWQEESLGRSAGWEFTNTGARTQIPAVVKPTPPS